MATSLLDFMKRYICAIFIDDYFEQQDKFVEYHDRVFGVIKAPKYQNKEDLYKKYFASLNKLHEAIAQGRNTDEIQSEIAEMGEQLFNYTSSVKEFIVRLDEKHTRFYLDGKSRLKNIGLTEKEEILAYLLDNKNKTSDEVNKLSRLTDSYHRGLINLDNYDAHFQHVAEIHAENMKNIRRYLWWKLFVSDDNKIPIC